MSSCGYGCSGFVEVRKMRKMDLLPETLILLLMVLIGLFVLIVWILSFFGVIK